MRFRFGVYELDETAGELRRAGEPVSIQPKPLELLTLLVRERSRVVPLDELMERLWPDTIVSPGSLNRAVSQARRAIGDTGRGQSLKSFARRGYRFVAEAAEVDDEETSQEARAATPTAGAAPPDDFVGRETPLAELRASRDATLQGETRIVLLTGRAGVGKTRLTEVFGDEARRSGFHVVLGRCRDRGSTPAFWLWAQVLRGLIEDTDLAAEFEARARSGELEALLPVLHEFAPELAARLPPAQQDVASALDERQRFRFFDAAQRALRACAKRRPILIVLEDLQWAGQASLRLLEHLSVELDQVPLFVLATVRDEPRDRDHPTNRAVASLRRHPRAREIALDGLSRAEVGAMLAHAAGGPVAVDVVSELYGRTEGLPLFVGEAIRLLSERGDLARPERLLRRGIALPPRAVDLIRRSIDAVSAECRALLGAGAVLGREFPLGAVVAVAGSTDRLEALEHLDEAVAAGILQTAPESAASYRFAHALFQESLYSELSPSQRARMHRAAADRLEQQHAEALEPVLSELAHHHHHGIAVGDPERAHDVALRAALQAERLLAWEQAATHYEQAVRSLDHFEVANPRGRITALLALGAAQRLSGNREQRIEAYDEALRVSRAIDDPALLTKAAIGLCDVSEWSSRVPESAEAALRDALARVDPSDLAARARLTGRLAYLSVRDRPRAEPLGREAVAIARESADAEALQECLYVLHYIISGPDDLAERGRLIGDLAVAARDARNPDTGVIAVLDVACDDLMQGQRATALERRAEAEALAGPQPSPTSTWHLRVWDAGMALLEGALERAERLASEALTLGQRLGHPFAKASYRGQLCVLARERGDYHVVVENLGHTLDDARLGATHWSIAVVGRAAGASGNNARAVALLDRLGQSRFLEIDRGIRWNATMAESSMLAAELGSVPHAQHLLPLLESAPGQHGLLPMVLSYGGPLSRCRAALQALLGYVDDALASYEEALEDSAAVGARPFEVWAQLEAAPLRARAGDARGAAATLRDTEALAGELGMLPAQRAAAAERQRLERPSAR
ncbi:MAG: AAA family ATPase [Myxococcota bacterium]